MQPPWHRGGSDIHHRGGAEGGSEDGGYGVHYGVHYGVQTRRGDAESGNEQLQTVRAAAPHLGEDHALQAPHALQALRTDLRVEISGLEKRIDEFERPV